MSEESKESLPPEKPEQKEEKAVPAKGEQAPALPVHRSIWPFALALAISVVIIGIMTHPIVLGLGVVLTIAAVIGWGLEQQK